MGCGPVQPTKAFEGEDQDMKAVKSLPARPAVPFTAPPLVTPHAGQMIGERYRLEEWLERGGMGSVWRAQQVRLRSPAAIKFLDPSLIEVPEMLERFLQEARSAAAVKSAHVIQVFDFGSEGGLPYIAMELLEGENLDTRLALRGTLSPAELDRIFSEVARGLGQAHELGVIHRDVKPGNIFLAREGRHEVTKLIDFGIAKVKADALRVSQSIGTELGTLLGTPQYMSPEQMRGRTTLDYRTDLWALAIIACECLTGRQPFSGTTMGDLTVQICTEEPLAPSTLGDVPAGFDQWFHKGTQKEPSERFESAAEMADALSVLLLPTSRRSRNLRLGRRTLGSRMPALFGSRPLPSAQQMRRAWSAASRGILRRSAWAWERARSLSSSSTGLLSFSTSLLRTQARRAAQSLRHAGVQRLWSRNGALGFALLVFACGLLFWRPQPKWGSLHSAPVDSAPVDSAPVDSAPVDTVSQQALSPQKPSTAPAGPLRPPTLPVLTAEDLPLVQEPAVAATEPRATPARATPAKATADRPRAKPPSSPVSSDDAPSSPMSSAMVRLGALLAQGGEANDARRPARAQPPAPARARDRASSKAE
ncbi:MAG: hypothetical protein RL685_334 [Pseudomonadota bacterium]|jgi:serine/threonine-protein kinase